MKKFLVCVILILIFLNSFAGVSLADGGPIYQAGLNVIPYHNNSIEMVKEDLFITFFNGRSIHPDKVSDRANIQAKFIFKNTGGETDQKIGFPFGIPRIEGEFRIIEPTVKVNGKAVKAELANPENDSRWLIFTVHFAKNEKKSVEVDYTVLPEPGYFLYVLKTGALWKGTIGELNVDISMQDRATYPYVISISPEGYKIEGNHIVYHLKDYEPEKNIEIEFLPYNFYKEIEPLRNKAMQTNSEDDYYAYARALLPDDPFGGFGMPNGKFDFLFDSGSADFEKFLMDELNNAFLHTKSGSVKNKILEAALYAHNFLGRFRPRYGASAYNQEVEGIDSLAMARDFLPFPQYTFWYFSDIFKNDLSNPQDREEKQAIAYYFFHLSNAEFAGDNPYAGFFALQKGLQYSKEIPDKKVWEAANPFYARELQKKQVYPFQECFVPDVEILNAREGKKYYATINFVYTLPAGMESFNYSNLLRAASSFYQPLDDEVKVPMEYCYEKVPPFRYIISLNLGSFQTESDFESKKKLLLSQKPDYATKYDVDYFAINAAEHSIYLLYPRLVLQNLEFDPTKGVSVKGVISNEGMVDTATSEVDAWIKELAEYGNTNPALQENLVGYMEFLADNKKLLAKSKAKLNIQYFDAKVVHSENKMTGDNRVSLEKVPKSGSPIHSDKIIIGALFAVIAILIALLIKKNKEAHSTHDNS